MAQEDWAKDRFLGSVTVGDRGQVVIPAEARERLGIEPGEKLLVFLDPMGWGVVFGRLEAMIEHSRRFAGLLTDMNAKPDQAQDGESDG